MAYTAPLNSLAAENLESSGLDGGKPASSRPRMESGSSHWQGGAG